MKGLWDLEDHSGELGDTISNHSMMKLPLNEQHTCNSHLTVTEDVLGSWHGKSCRA
jgi:hypothetical protein